MAGKPESNASAADEEPSMLREWTTSTLLIVFTLTLGLLCVLVLSCTLTQTRMSSISIDGVNISVWKLDDIRKQWTDIRNQIHTQSDALAKAQEEFSQAAKENSDFDLKYRPARTAIDALLGAFISRVRESDDKLVNAMRNEGPVERVVRIEVTKDDLLKAHPELQQLVEDILTLGPAYKKIDSERIVKRGAFDTKKARVEELQERLKSLQASLGALFAAQFNNKTIDEPTRARMENALFELYTEKFPGAYINSLIVTPPDILTLVLVISMGVLGSALQMTHALFKHNRVERAGVYFLRLSVGAITALVIFIVAKAGVPVIADASRLGGDAPINPYFVSFLAIISGLMSENAILSVQTQGARFFAPETAPEQLRWARSDLRETFKKANRNPENVRRLLNVESSQFDSWISGKESVPANAQMMIAGVLEIPQRDLFTDLPPEEASVDGTSPR
jgi:hypothetical protein